MDYLEKRTFGIVTWVSSVSVGPVRSLRALILYLLGVFLGAALLAPWLMLGFKSLSSHAFFADLAAKPFHRVVTRTVMVLALLGLWPWLKASGVKNLSAIGLTSPKGRAGEVWRGFGIGFVSLALVAIASVLCGARVVNGELPLGSLLRIASTAMLSAVSIAVAEEILFRGVIFCRLKPELGTFGAVGLSSAVYSMVHFFARVTEPTTITWRSGFDTLGMMFGGFVDIHALFPGFLVLMLVGAILAWMTHTTGSLYASMGLHTGWVFWMKMHSATLRPGPADSATWWGDAKITDGWVTFGVVLVCAVLVFRQKGRTR